MINIILSADAIGDDIELSIEHHHNGPELEIDGAYTEEGIEIGDLLTDSEQEELKRLTEIELAKFDLGDLEINNG